MLREDKGTVGPQDPHFSPSDPETDLGSEVVRAKTPERKTDPKGKE